RVLQFSSICFDASVEQLFLTLLSGAALVLISKETLMDSESFAAFIARMSITHIHAVPSFLMNMSQNVPSSLKRILSGGDICPPQLAQKWSSRCDFYNRYGPTETTVTSLESRVKEIGNHQTTLPIGKPIANTCVYIVDKYMKLVPQGVTGELVIGGHGVVRGYLNRPELTAERFVYLPGITEDNPNDLHATDSGRRLFKTGDLARYLPDGNIEFQGRMDFQVKIRGFRIELGEIENQLLRLEEIKET
ncbi:MAG: amino acid adenylation domain-containing protein, partial [bacterium]|nr:amino acid adenylation domain-containing protein [bacterium]